MIINQKGLMKTIESTNGYWIQVSDEDYEYLSQWAWHYNSKTGPSRVDWAKGANLTIYMVAVILDRQEILHPNDIDHKDRNNLNNQRNNLRPATRSQNISNTGLRVTNSSGYIGVCFDKSRNKWLAYIGVQKERINIGRYATAEGAARARDAMAKVCHGEFAVLNFPD